MPKITKKFIDQISNKEGRSQYWDDNIKGFGVRVSINGKKVFIIKYRVGGGRAGRQRWFTIGSCETITCEQARQKAVKLLAEISEGHDPQEDKEIFRNALNVSDLWEKYKTEYLPKKKPRSQKEDIRIWEVYIKPSMHNLKVTNITAKDISIIHQQFMDRPYQGNRVYALLSKMMNLAEMWGYREQNTNPCYKVKKYKEHKRDKYLKKSDIEKLGEELSVYEKKGDINKYIASAIRVLLLTGARLNEVLTAKWEWVDFESRIINIPDSKTGKKTIFLNQPSLEILNQLKLIPEKEENPYIFRGRKPKQNLINISNAWRKICKNAGIKMRIHDLRHTAASIAVAQGANLPIVGRLLGHSNSSTTQRYAHVDIDPALQIAESIGNVINDAWKG